MFTLNLKGTANPKNEKLVKLEVVFYKSGHSRITKSLKDITGFYEDWDKKNQSFRTNDEESQKKNKILFELKQQYEQVAPKWEAQGKDWNRLERKYCFNGSFLVQKKLKDRIVYNGIFVNQI